MRLRVFLRGMQQREDGSIMKISTKGRYATRIMLDLAENGVDGSYISLKEISGRQNISVKYLEQIIAALSKSGYVVSSRGSAGGYRLTRQPEAYTIGEILRAVEGSLAPVSCVEDSSIPCERAETCKTIRFWRGLYEVVSEYVDGKTLADLMTK